MAMPIAEDEATKNKANQISSNSCSDDICNKKSKTKKQTREKSKQIQMSEKRIKKQKMLRFDPLVIFHVLPVKREEYLEYPHNRKKYWWTTAEEKDIHEQCYKEFKKLSKDYQKLQKEQELQQPGKVSAATRRITLEWWFRGYESLLSRIGHDCSEKYYSITRRQEVIQSVVERQSITPQYQRYVQECSVMPALARALIDSVSIGGGGSGGGKTFNINNSLVKDITTPVGQDSCNTNNKKPPPRPKKLSPGNINRLLGNPGNKRDGE